MEVLKCVIIIIGMLSFALIISSYVEMNNYKLDDREKNVDDDFKDPWSK